ncbi:MAG: excinuclease ABC subunit UvrA [Patescibacteria group bacterium]
MEKTNEQHYIKVRGARQHNLKNVDLDIPKNKLVIFTGVSGSGKSSLAFDTIYAEGQRRYVESLSSYARQFLGVMQKPDVDFIEGLSPAISIDQKTTSHNPRSTVGTVTEIYDYLRLLFARIGHPHCPVCGREISNQSIDQIVENALALITQNMKANGQVRFMVLSPVVKDRKGEFTGIFENLKSKGYKRVRIDGLIKDILDDIVLIKTNKHTIDAVVDRLTVTKKELKDESQLALLKKRLSDSFEQALHLSDGLALLVLVNDSSFEFPDIPRDTQDCLFSERFACPVDNISLPEIEPRSFSFNSPQGACPTCLGLGKILKVNAETVFSEDLSINEGAILPFSTMFENDTWYGRLIKTVCEENNIPMNRPVRSLTQEQKDIILLGTANREYKVYGTNRFGRSTTILETYPGVVVELERRHTSTESDFVRSEIEKYMREIVCGECLGARLKKEALGVTIDDNPISVVAAWPIDKALDWICSLSALNKLSNREKQIATMVLNEITTRLTFLKSVGLDYLSLDRPAGSLAGGEAQRIRLASQIGSGLTGVLYVLDEPTIGLHSRDNDRLIETLKKLRDLGNTVVVVEHDEDMMKASDYIFDFGPGAGKLGGEVIAQGTSEEIVNNKNSITGQYLSGKRKVHSTVPSMPQLIDEEKFLEIKGVNQFNLKNIDVKIPLKKFVVVTGVSGSGKSTLVVDTIYHAVASKINHFHKQVPGEFKSMDGVTNLDKVSLIDQSPIGRTPRSNPATYTKMFDHIRIVFAATREAKASGYGPGRFSFNVKGGRCEACEGQGQIKIEMQFMPDIWVTCEVCKGKRYNSHTLEILYRGKNIAEVLDMTVSEAKEFFQNNPVITRKLETLEDVGLDYMELGQPATTLSGGEAQRVKLATELSKKHTGKTMYILDEPTTGLHFADLQKLLNVLKVLVSYGNTVLVIEHNMDIVRNADWIIDLGPEGGNKGGEIVAQGTPKDIANTPKSYTGKYI